MVSNSLRRVLEYHARTRQGFDGYAAGPGGLDWANRADPFPTYAGAPQPELPLPGESPTARYPDLFAPGRMVPQNLPWAAWPRSSNCPSDSRPGSNTVNARWALRCKASSGNLHPTEAYLVVAAC